MFSWYIKSTIIFMVINFCIANILKSAYLENGWIVGQKVPMLERIRNLFMISAVPIFRVFVTVMMIFMACTSRDEFDELIDKMEDRK